MLMTAGFKILETIYIYRNRCKTRTIYNCNTLTDILKKYLQTVMFIILYLKYYIVLHEYVKHGSIL